MRAVAPAWLCLLLGACSAGPTRNVPEAERPAIDIAPAPHPTAVAMVESELGAVRQAVEAMEVNKDCARDSYLEARASWEDGNLLLARGEVAMARESFTQARATAEHTSWECVEKDKRRKERALARQQQPEPEVVKPLDPASRMVGDALEVGKDHLSRSDRARAEDALHQTLALYQRLPAPVAGAVVDAAAEAQFLLAESLREDYEAMAPVAEADQLVGLLDRKAVELSRAEQEYRKVLDLGAGCWTAAARFRTGQLYELFGRSILATPCPAELDLEDCRALRAKLDELAAHPLHTATGHYRSAMQGDVVCEWTDLARRALENLARWDTR